MSTQQKSLAQYAAVGALLGGAFIAQFLWPLALAGIVLWCVVLAKTTTLKSAFLNGWLAGVVKVALVLSWYWSTFPLQWMNIHPVVIAALIIFIYWVFTSVVIGFGFAVASIFAWWCIKTQPLIRIVCVPAALVCAEVLGSLFFSIYILGPGSNVNTDFSFGYVGYLLNNHATLRLASIIGGVYLLTYIAGVLGVLVYETLLTKNKKVRVGAGVFFVLVVVSGFFVMTPLPTKPSLHMRVALVGSDFSLEANKSPAAESAEQQMLIDTVEASFAYDPDYVLVPESAAMTNGQTPSSTLSWLAAEGKGAILIDSSRVDLPDQTSRVRAFIFDPKTSTVYQSDKRYLAPQGEYVPYFYTFLFTALGTKDFFTDRTKGTVYIPGNGPSSKLPPTIPAIMFCSENIPPLSITDAVRERQVPFVAHPVSHSWFHTPYVLWNESRDMVALHALSNRVPVLQAGNLAPTVGFGADGRYLKPIAQKTYIHTQLVIYDL